MMERKVEIQPAGDGGMVVVFGRQITRQTHQQVCALTLELQKVKCAGIREIVPAYCSVMLYYDVQKVSFGILRELVMTILKERSLEGKLVAGRILEVPVCYDGVLAPDMEYVQRSVGLNKQELIRVHTAKPHLVYMIGFMPGFPYMGGMPFSLPRQSVPRRQVPPGSVGVAANQTGIYTVEGAGEWWLIGRTPLRIFDADREAPFLLAQGDYVQFREISTDEYFRVREKIVADEYKPVWQTLKEAVG